MFIVSPVQNPELKGKAGSWGTFLQYAEYGEDRFAVRCVREYQNSYITRYDRVHWMDQFGALPDFRYGRTFVKQWGEPERISADLFEEKWTLAEKSPPYFERDPSPPKPPPWIILFESGKWKEEAR